MIHLLHGEDALSRSRAVKELLPAPGSDAYAGVTLFEAPVEVQRIVEACRALPFLADTRYVLVRNFISFTTRRRRAGGESDEAPASDADGEPASGPRPAQQLRDVLPDFPSSTELVLEESGKVPATSVLYKYARSHGEEREFRPLVGEDLLRWIRQQFAERQASVHPLAIQTLAAYVGPDLLLLEREIDKLCAYAAGRAVQEEDVAEMVSSAADTKVWGMIDEAARGNAPAALLQLRQVLADSANPPLRTLGAIANRFRLMLMIKELADQRLSDGAVAQRTGQQDWSIRNTRPLLRHFTLPELKRIHELLLETDIALKHSPMDDKLTLELLVLAIARRDLAPQESLPEPELDS
ncbi:MAG: DNA polymerase III subunit delta [Chloroflexota bacterium]